MLRTLARAEHLAARVLFLDSAAAGHQDGERDGNILHEFSLVDLSIHPSGGLLQAHIRDASDDADVEIADVDVDA